ncbi:hypothetical protein Vretifemale_18704, partial [Volvox reticuliferus]
MDYGRVDRAARREVPPSGTLSRILRKDLRDQNSKTRSSLKADVKPPWRPAGRIEKPGEETGVPQEIGITSPAASPRSSAAHYFNNPASIPQPFLAAPPEPPAPLHHAPVPLWDGQLAANLPSSSSQIPSRDRSLQQAGPVSIIGSFAGGKLIAPDAKLPGAAWPLGTSNRRSSGGGPASVTRARAPLSARQSTLFTADGVELTAPTEDLYVRSKAAEAHLAHRESQVRPQAQLVETGRASGLASPFDESHSFHQQGMSVAAATPVMQANIRTQFTVTPVSGAAHPSGAFSRGEVSIRQELDPGGQSLLQAAHASARINPQVSREGAGGQQHVANRNQQLG